MTPDPISDVVSKEAGVEDVLTHLFGLNELDRQVFALLLSRDDAVGVDEIAAHVDRDRSTVFRSLTRLRGTGFVERRQENFDGGGYRHVFRAADPDEMAAEMRHTLNAIYAKFGPLTDEFKQKYRRDDADPTTVEH